MKNNTFQKIKLATLASVVILSINSCNKTPLSPSQKAIVASDKGAQAPVYTSFSISNYNPVYGVSQSNNLYSVDPATGNQTSLGFMTFGGGAEYPVNVTGIALSTNALTPANYVVTSIGNNPCLNGSGTTFFLGNLPSTSLSRMGTLLGRSIKDIEYNPIDGFLYGIEGNNIVKILSLGVGCGPGTTAVSPVVVTIGQPSSVGVGPYSLAFNYAGQCNVVSATDHMRAIVDLSTLNVASGTLFPGGQANMVNPQEVAFCISKQILLIATNDKLTTTSNDLSYYQFGTSSAGVVGAWNEKSDNCLADYTSKPQSNTVIVRL